jgi:glycosidase
MNLLGSHDTPRFRSVVQDDFDRHRIGVGMLMTFPGIPSIFQGDEFGMRAEHSHGTRAPIPWRDHDPKAFDLYQQFVALRNQHRVLRHGGFRWVATADDVLSYLREDLSESILIRAQRDLSSGTGAERRSIDQKMTDELAKDGFVTTAVRDLLAGVTGNLEDVLRANEGIAVVQLTRRSNP